MRAVDFGVLSAIHGRPPTLVRGRPCCFFFERAEGFGTESGFF